MIYPQDIENDTKLIDKTNKLLSLS